MGKDREYPFVSLKGERDKKRGHETAKDVIAFARRFDRYTRLDEGDVEDIAKRLEEGETVLYLGITNMLVTGSDKKTKSLSATSLALTDRRFFFVRSPYSADGSPHYLDLEGVFESVPLESVTRADIEDIGSERPGGKTYLKLQTGEKTYRAEMIQNFLSQKKNVAERERILSVFVSALEAAHGGEDPTAKKDGAGGFSASAK